MPDSISRTSPWLTLGSAMLTPNVVLQILKDGNERFVSGNSAGHDVHEALKNEYLNGHINPIAVEYYLCGPPVMIQSAKDMFDILSEIV